MTKQAWVLRLKEEVSSRCFDGAPRYLINDESVDYLTKELQRAFVTDDKDGYMEFLKHHDQVMIDNFGKDAIRDFGWENISKHFDFVEVEVD